MILKEKDGYSVVLNNKKLTKSLPLEKAQQAHKVLDWLIGKTKQ